MGPLWRSPSHPHLRCVGWLTLGGLTKEEFAKDMIALYGGLRFRRVRPDYAGGTQLIWTYAWKLWRHCSCAHRLMIVRISSKEPKSTTHGKLSRRLL